MSKGIYRRGNTLWMTKTIAGIQYRESCGTESMMEARAVRERWVAELRNAAVNGRPVRKQKPEPAQAKETTFEELCIKYLEFTDGRLKWHDRLKSFVGTLGKRFKDKPLEDFSIMDVEKLQSETIRRNCSVSYANRLTAVLKVMFNKALDWELVTEETVKRVRKVKLLKGENRRLRYLQVEEAERLIQNCNEHLRPLVITALHTGMRRGEIFGLTWDRVDLKNRLILLDKTKNGERRELPINDTLLAALSKLTRRIGCDFVFYNPDTGRGYDNLKHSWANALMKSHIIDFRFHDLRHTFASWLIMAGVDLATVQQLMGHKDIKMTLRYAHLAPAHVKSAVFVLDEKITKKSQSAENGEISNGWNP